jgi:hypothetical protein
MKWIEILKTLGIETGGEILLLIVIGFFGKKIFEYFFSKSLELKKAELNQGLESHKQNLQSETTIYRLNLDKDMEEFKGELNKLSFEHQTKYIQLHTDRASTITKLYNLLNDLETKMESLMRPFQDNEEKPIEEKFKDAADSANEFVNYYKSKEILFNAKTCELFEKINDGFLKAWKLFRTSKRFSQGASPELSQEFFEKEMDAYYETLLTEIPVLKNELKDDFRAMLGVEKG